MDNSQYDELYQRWLRRSPDKIFWSTELALEFNASSTEALRSSFRRWRQRREKNAVPSTQGQQKIKTGARILLFDIEISPINALVWGIWEQNINIEAILQDWHLLSWSAKWLFEDKVYSDVLTPAEAQKHDDKRIVESIWKLLDQADITVAHNGDRFDHKRLNTRFLVHGLPPLSHYKSIDTLVVAKNVFAFSSNKLDYINDYLGIPKKTETNFELWKNAYFGDAEALATLKKYNIRDSEILEELFLRLRPFIKNFPNLNLYTNENTQVCRKCSSPDLTWSGYYYTNVSRYKGWRCNNCGAIGRDRYSDLDKDKKKSVVV